MSKRLRSLISMKRQARKAASKECPGRKELFLEYSRLAASIEAASIQPSYIYMTQERYDEIIASFHESINEGQ